MAAPLTADNLADLRRFIGLHSLGRVAAHPEAELAHIRQSQRGGMSSDLKYGVNRDGILIEPKEGSARYIRWVHVHAHADRYATEQWRADFKRIDHRWCQVAASDIYGRTSRYNLEYSWLIQQLLETHALHIWQAETTIDTEAAQLDLF